MDVPSVLKPDQLQFVIRVIVDALSDTIRHNNRGKLPKSEQPRETGIYQGNVRVVLKKSDK